LLEIADLNVIHSTRGYHPIALTYFGNEKISDSERETLKSPTWPLKADNGTVWDKSELKKKLIEPWQPLIDNGVTIHVGEWGCFNHTPHPIMLAWAKDILSIWKEAGWGHALWNLRGPFGVLDSDRKDAAYEDYKGHKLDRKFLELLKEFI
jgi:endoglucanase